MLSTIEKVFDENYKPNVDNPDRVKMFLSDPVWRDLCDMLEVAIQDATNQVVNPEVAPDLNVIQYLRGEIFTLKYIREMPNMMIEAMEQQAVEAAQMGDETTIGQEDDFNAK